MSLEPDCTWLVCVTNCMGSRCKFSFLGLTLATVAKRICLATDICRVAWRKKQRGSRGCCARQVCTPTSPSHSCGPCRGCHQDARCAAACGDCHWHLSVLGGGPRRCCCSWRCCSCWATDWSTAGRRGDDGRRLCGRPTRKSNGPRDSGIKSHKGAATLPSLHHHHPHTRVTRLPHVHTRSGVSKSIPAVVSTQTFMHALRLYVHVIQLFTCWPLPDTASAVHTINLSIRKASNTVREVFLCLAARLGRITETQKHRNVVTLFVMHPLPIARLHFDFFAQQAIKHRSSRRGPDTTAFTSYNPFCTHRFGSISAFDA